ncbi:hypothetical protein E2C01_046368 [Portunus trituberculatus]|uniref:Uncharacterized protein n=1 Tax=Portunus trituberculatus TaxID=210409 RepID=A0A5B7G5T7_PORTR|nr:hypothetical protein [Portunus trituberculatus]
MTSSQCGLQSDNQRLHCSPTRRAGDESCRYDPAAPSSKQIRNPIRVLFHDALVLGSSVAADRQEKGLGVSALGSGRDEGHEGSSVTLSLNANPKMQHHTENFHLIPL